MIVKKRRTAKAVPKLQFLEQFPLKNAGLQAIGRKTAQACDKTTSFGTGSAYSLSPWQITVRFVLAAALFSVLACKPAGSSSEPLENPDPQHMYIWEQSGTTWNIIHNPSRTTDYGSGSQWTLSLSYRAESTVPVSLRWNSVPPAFMDDASVEPESRSSVFYFYPKLPFRGRSVPLVFHSERWGNPPLAITLETGPGFEVLDVQFELRESDPLQPLSADLGTMLYYPPSRWRNPRHEFFTFSRHPEILYLVSRSFKIQSHFLKRLAFFTEKPGFAGTLARDEEIAGLRDWFAHDYQASSLAAFFDEAHKQHFPLNEGELLLRDMLLVRGIIRERESGSGFVEGDGALLGFSVESGDRLVVYYVHETVHGLEFTQPELQTLFREFFESLSGAEKDFMRDALSYREYNVVKDRHLLASETAAYLLQQPPAETDRYFWEYILPWYTAYHQKSGLAGNAPPAFLAADPGIFGKRSAALQKRFEENTGLRAETFFDLLPADDGKAP